MSRPGSEEPHQHQQKFSYFTCHTDFAPISQVFVIFILHGVATFIGCWRQNVVTTIRCSGEVMRDPDATIKHNTLCYGNFECKFMQYTQTFHNLKRFPLAPMGVLTPHLRTLKGVACPPINRNRCFGQRERGERGADIPMGGIEARAELCQAQA